MTKTKRSNNQKNKHQKKMVRNKKTAKRMTPKNKLKQQLSIDYLFRLMAEPDIYNSTGVVG